MLHIVNSTQKAFTCLALLMLLYSSSSFINPTFANDTKVGRFATNFGPLILYQGEKDRLAGFYYYKSQPAHLFLKRKNNGSYTGIWVQAKSERKCTTKKNGSPYWGTINAAFKDKNFLALWNYCDVALVNQKNRQWKGKPK